MGTWTVGQFVVAQKTSVVVVRVIAGYEYGGGDARGDRDGQAVERDESESVVAVAAEASGNSVRRFTGAISSSHSGRSYQLSVVCCSRENVRHFCCNSVINPIKYENNAGTGSVYEVYVKEDSAPESRNGDVAGVSGSVPVASHQLTQVNNRYNNFIKNESDFLPNEITFKEECVDLDDAVESEVINIGSAVTKLGKDALRYKIFEQSISAPDKNVVVYSHPVTDVPSSSTTTRLIDKDDPRSRLHFVKYLKRDGKTLKIWECGICSKEFRHQYTLMRHLPTHTDERNFKCEACGKAFRQLSTLSQHKAIHSDARPYVCEFCKKTFNRVSTLISHRKTHSEHKPHKCHVCGKGFHQKGNLRNHVFTHTNERPYKCELCSKGFNQMSNLVCHKVKAHAHADKMQYSCGVCGKEFPRRFALRSHEEYKHGIKYRSTGNAQSVTNETGNAGKSKNVRIIQLSNGDRNQTNESKEKDYFGSSDVIDSIVINKIDTKAMEMAVLQGQTPFALYKPAKGIPVLVKISPTANNKHMLTPATAEDLRMAGKITLNSTEAPDADGNKAVQVKVPVVATVTQNIELDGRSSFVIEPPGAEQEQGKLSCRSSKARWRRGRCAPLFNLSSDDLVTALDSQFSPTVLNRNELDRQNGPGSTTSIDECNELLELAAQGGIQFVRATEDGRYEVMTNSEARDLMAQNSHDVTILDGEQADAINLANIRNNGDVIIGDNDNQIMVLESGQKSSGMSMDGIEILDDKDIRILDSKSLDDRFVDGMTFLSQTKIDDLLLGSKSLPIDGDGALAGHDDAMAVTSSQQDLTSILGHPSNLTSSQSSLSSLLMKNHPPLSLLSETLPYLKSNQSLTEDLNILGVSPMEEHHSAQDYDPKMKLSSVFDDDCDTGLMPFGQSDMKMLDSGSQCMKVQSVEHRLRMILIENTSTRHIYMMYFLPQTFSDRFSLPPPKIFPGLNEVKILGPKNHAHELITPHYQDTRFLSPYEQFLKNTSMQNAYVPNVAEVSEGCRKEVKILGKKLGTGIITTTEEGDIVKVIDDKSKFESTMNFCDSALQQCATVSPRRMYRQPPMENDTDNFLLQVNTFENNYYKGDDKENVFRNYAGWQSLFGFPEFR
ncbi:uncharacterized protein LOC105835607 [Monomorium pharaonis]|uniref:uncharacterized protein LOC105835607 n=1 Tax=Monomorium pharaonis TaxID=307658 RepID=UPI001746D7B2|nr:uncharacterized protein LOC105835607 [Monomorium pharaonis]